jgi:membrane associated rhomboid family serine protease
MRWKLDQFRKKFIGVGGESEQPRPQLCPACRTLVGAGAKRCHQCGASMTFSMAAASRSLGRLMPATSPVTYGILTISCLLFLVSLLATVREGGFQAPGGGLFSLFNFGAISNVVLQRLGASLPLPYNLAQPWRFVMAIFLHGSILHILFNMGVLMDIGPQVEEQYGSSRYLLIYVLTGIGGFFFSSTTGHSSVGGSGAILGLIGILLAGTIGRRSAGSQMLRSQLIRWLIYILVLGLLFPAIDNWAHGGGLAIGFLLGKIMTDRPPATAEERKLAYALGWGAALIVAVSFAMVIFENFRAG